MRTVRRLLALVVALAGVGAGFGILVGPGPAGAQSGGPHISLDRQEVFLGEPIIISLFDFEGGQVTVAVCGNLAKRGSADCNMPAAQSERIRPDGSVTLTQLFVQPPPVPCPCLVRASTATTDEFAVASIVVVDHPSGPVVEQENGPLIDVSVDAERAPQGLMDSLRTALGGPTTYEVTVAVRNVTTETLSNVELSGSAEHRLSDATALEIGLPGPIEPGQTWEQTVEAEIPAPVVGRFIWTVTGRGAGTSVVSTQATSTTPILLFLFAAILVVDLAAIVWRLGMRRRRRREDVDDDDASSDEAGSDEAGSWDDETIQYGLPPITVPS